MIYYYRFKHYRQLQRVLLEHEMDFHFLYRPSLKFCRMYFNLILTCSSRKFFSSCALLQFTVNCLCVVDLRPDLLLQISDIVLVMFWHQLKLFGRGALVTIIGDELLYKTYQADANI